jgi:chemotaxis protein CheY-P-specific phosphatase CheC
MTDEKPSILLIDDSQFSLSQWTRALGDAYNIDTAGNGAEGLVKMGNRKYDLVITDLLMPQISGLAFLGQVRHRYPGTRVIVCSADVQDATAKKAKTLGAAAFVSKPVDPDELRRVVRLVLAHEKPPRELPIDPKYADAFGEIFNIGVGKAADALSKLVYDAVRLSVPKLEIIRPEQLASRVVDDFQDDVACVRQDFTGGAQGSAFLLLSARSGLNLVDALVRQESPDMAQLSAADREMLVEVGNILINSLVGTLANTLGMDFSFGQASCVVADPSSVYGHMKLNGMDYVVYVETLFVVPGRQIGGNLVIVMGSAGMGSILQGIDRIL